tara:strand:- start:72 stop:629 length:558 start_codon:yes stop_codon:yes gene_type:complete
MAKKSKTKIEQYSSRKSSGPKTIKKKVNKPKESSLIGKKAPAFIMPTDTGAQISLKALRGKCVILFFYPKDGTAGCTTEVQAFRDSRLPFLRKGIIIIGVSKDSVESHKKFKAKQRLNFDLASDSETRVCEDYGVWKKKNMYGREYMGIERSTFLIDEKGIVCAEWRKVRVQGHVEEVTAALNAL